MMDEDGFCLVRRHKRRRKKFPKIPKNLDAKFLQLITLINREPSDPIPEVFDDFFKKTQDDLKSGNFIHQFQKDLFILLDEWNLVVSPQDLSLADCPSITEISPTAREDCSDVDIICYGLGKFSSCPIALFQLGLLLILQQSLHPVHVHLYDPQFSVHEIDYLKKVGLNVLEVNEQCKRTPSRKSIFFMPHCDLELYNNLLWANWNVKGLSEIAIIGNSLENYELKMCMGPKAISMARKRYKYVYMANQFITEIKMANIFHNPNVFNDSSIHYFKPSSLSLVDSSVWTHLEEPSYDINIDAD